MKKITLIIITAFFTISCSPKYVSFIRPNPEEITTNTLKLFLNSTESPKIVLRVPNMDENSMSSNTNDGYYGTIEKEFLKKGYIVRDRDLFVEVLEKTEGQVNYKKLGRQTDTDLIIELVKFDTEVIYRTNIYSNGKGKTGTLKDEYRYYGIEIEFKIILIENNEFAGSYRYSYAPCEKGCIIDKGTTDFFKFKKKHEPKYKIIEKPILEEFIKNVTNDLIISLNK